MNRMPIDIELMSQLAKAQVDYERGTIRRIPPSIAMLLADSEFINNQPFRDLVDAHNLDYELGHPTFRINQEIN